MAAVSSSMVSAPSSINLSLALSDAEQRVAEPLLSLLLADNEHLTYFSDRDQSSIMIKRFIDGRGLACPMPLLKTKVALRDVANEESLYVVATDANSQADIAAFCRQSQQTDATDTLLLTVNQVTTRKVATGSSVQHSDTIYHFIITKTDSN
ncbi:sulfurtransferase TusA family protein [Psychrobacter sp. B38]|uniref:sulfurtransferase TusA family protein n=1 Tax=Psychrobacter sp. B38 TaxID=3143538 RepID=UPI00320FC7FB